MQWIEYAIGNGRCRLIAYRPRLTQYAALDFSARRTGFNFRNRAARFIGIDLGELILIDRNVGVARVASITDGLQ